MKILALTSLALLVAGRGHANPSMRAIEATVVLDAPLTQVWQAWTSEEGVKSFFAPACNVDLRPDGLYEIFFFPDNEPGRRGAEGTRVLVVEPEERFAFTWSAPPHLPNVRQQRTRVELRFESLGEEQTRLSLRHDGWGEGDEWDQAFAYFESAWKDVVLVRLEHRFRIGPVDWTNPPRTG